jgi:hypothetical protein
MKHDDEIDSEKKSSGGMTEMARRILLTGLGAIFMTPDTVRKVVGDLKLPKDAMGYFLDTAVRQKDEVLGLLATELSKFLSKIKVHEELQKAFAGLQVHVDAKFNFDQKNKAPSSSPKVVIKKVR